ncbi:AraC family transcriptional regulator ligand-binding domain-containing protein [Streptomyces sulphureus]|uniref:AraC family transcriptional regulator ligand-binding domain-containing protein n=1 Tax=Streptomyces sulphureus TaxID=47758 RepID=UPI000995E4BE
MRRKGTVGDPMSSPRGGGSPSSSLGAISVAGPRVLLDLLSRMGVDSRRLARATGLDTDRLTDPAGWVEGRLGMDLLNRAAETVGDPLFGAHFGRDHQPGRLGLFDYLFLTADSLAAAFDTAIRYISVATTGGAYGWAEGGGRPVVERTLPGGPHFLHAETYALSWHLTMARHATGSPIRPTHVGLVQPAPKRHHALTEILGVDDVDFGCPATTITLKRRDLDLPLLGADPMLAVTLRRHADGRRLPADSWPERVRAFLSDGFADRPVTLDAAARHLAVSPRMLQQHLREAGTSWRAEVETARDSRAVDLLRNSALPVRAIAIRLGYSDDRAFRRAFHRRHDCGPDAYRRGTLA